MNPLRALIGMIRDGVAFWRLLDGQPRCICGAALTVGTPHSCDALDEVSR